MPDLLCTEKIYSEDYLDFLIEYFETDEILKNEQGECLNIIDNRYGVYYREGNRYRSRDIGNVCIIPHCYALLSSDQMLENAGIARVQRQPGLDLYGQGVLVGFIDTGERVIILSS